MELAAITTGSPLEAAAILFAFVLGTAPLFVLVGILARGTAVLQRRLTAAAAIVVVALGLYSINGVLVATDSVYSAQNIAASVRSAFGQQKPASETASRVTIAVAPNGYSPSRVTVPAGQSVQISLEKQGTLGCTSTFLIPKLSIQTDISRGNKIVTTIFPEPGSYRFTCGMGMYSGTIDAI
jgi:plastocyanin